jgi:hypothetical protein
MNKIDYSVMSEKELVVAFDKYMVKWNNIVNAMGIVPKKIPTFTDWLEVKGLVHKSPMNKATELDDFDTSIPF